MNRHKSADHKRSRFANYIGWVVILVIIVQSNHRGHGASLNNVSDSVISEQPSREKNPLPEPAHAIKSTSPVEGSRFSMMKKLFSLSIIFNHICVVVLSLLILDYLNSQPIVKQSLLSYLYKDFILNLTTLHCVWALLRVTQHLSGNGYEMNELQSKVMSFIIYFMRFHGIVFLNLIAILNVYMMKKAMINPPMPWGDDEDLGIKILRVSTFVPIFLFMTTMYMFGMHPYIHFSLWNDNVAYSADLHKITVIFMAPLSFLVITLLITHLVTLHYKHSHQQNLDTGIPQMNYYLGVIIAILILAQVIFYVSGV